MPGTGSPDSLKLAVDNVVSYYFPSTATRVVCLFHLGHERIARLLDANLERRGRTATLVRTDDSTTSWDALRAEIQGAIAGADLVVNLYFLRYQGGEWMSERIRFLRELIIGERPLVSKEQYLLFKDMDEAAFARIFSVDPLSIDRLNRALISLGNGASQWRITSGHGTDLSIGVDTARWPLINYNGFSPSDYEMPPGEVLTYPQSIDGHLVLSGILLGTVPIGRKYGCLHEPIVDIEFADGRACAVRSAREELRQDIEFCLSLDEWVCRAGEVGIGTHVGLDRLLGLNYEYEERFPGFHVGLGVSESDEAIGGQRQTDHHLDLVLLKSTIHFDDACVMRDGQFTDVVTELAKTYRR